MRSVVLAACLLAACGDNQHGTGQPLSLARDLVVVAHQDDDLIFMQPDLAEAVQAHTGVTNVYVTAGNGKKGPPISNARYTGLMKAYGAAAGDQAWECGWIKIARHEAQHCRLDSANVSLVFLAYPDGGKLGELPNSLLDLWQGDIPRATTIADRTASYSREELIDVVAEIVEQTQPATVRTLDLTSGHGRDHIDHLIVGALTALALARVDLDPELIAYRGYDTGNEPVNRTSALFDQARTLLGYYDACASDGCGVPCGESCPKTDKIHTTWLGRRYTVGVRRTARGKLRTANGCLTGSTLAACDTAPAWVLDHGHLVGPTGCLALDGDRVVVAPCGEDLAQRWFADDEGHLWSGTPPAFGPNLSYAHLRCITPADDGTVSAPTCDNKDNTAPRWQWAPDLAVTSRTILAATGRAVRIADVDGDRLGDLCAVTTTGLECAPGRGDGTFGPVTRIDRPDAPLAIDPQSLTFGDLDGDGLADACGRDALGVLCARSTAGYAAVRFTPEFGDSDASAATSCSLRIADANGDGMPDICGIANEGVVCTPGGSSFEPQVRSAWPDRATVLVPADLDGDHHTDWCTLTADGPACAITAESALTTDGIPWGFSLGGVVETAPSDPALADLADIDGDGDADLCSLTGDGTIGCARSTRHGFGPRTVVAVLPDSATATSLWLGDLDGDGRADACVDLGDRIACAIL